MNRFENMPDAELNAAILRLRPGMDIDGFSGERMPPYSTSFDSLVPMLEKYNVYIQKDCYEDGGWFVEIWIGSDDHGNWVGRDASLPRAACVALILANSAQK